MKTNREYKRRFPWFSASLGVIALASVATLFVSGQLNAGQGEFGLTRALSSRTLTIPMVMQRGEMHGMNLWVQPLSPNS